MLFHARLVGEYGNLEIWNPKIRKMKIIIMNIRRAQSNGGILISRKKSLLTLVGVILFFPPMGRTPVTMIVLLLIFSGGPVGSPCCYLDGQIGKCTSL